MWTSIASRPVPRPWNRGNRHPPARPRFTGEPLRAGEGGATTGSTPAGRMLAQCCYSTFILFVFAYCYGRGGFQFLPLCQHFARSLTYSIASPVVT